MRPSTIVTTLVVYTVLFPVYGYVTWAVLGHEHAGQLGDTFGLLNAFASGLALFGIVTAIFLQRQELELQREEIALNRQELARSFATIVQPPTDDDIPF